MIRLERPDSVPSLIHLSTSSSCCVGVIDQSGMKITYLNKQRTHNAGMAVIGHTVTPMMITPPSVKEFTVIGNCESGCTEKVGR